MNPPTIIKEGHSNLLKPITIKNTHGIDVIESIINLSRHNQVNLAVLSAFGAFSDIHILNPLTFSCPDFLYSGVYETISIKGTYMYSHAPYSSPEVSDSSHCNKFSIFFFGDQGTVSSGIVAGKLMAASVVVVTLISFKNPEYHAILSNVNENVQVNQEGGEHAATVVIDHHSGDPSAAVASNHNNAHFISNMSTYVVGGSSNTACSNYHRQHKYTCWKWHARCCG